MTKLDEIKARNEARRGSAIMYHHHDLSSKALMGICTDIDALLGKLDEIEKWIDNPNFTHVQRLHRIEVVVRGYVKGKKGDMTEEDEARLLYRIQHEGGK